MSEFKVYEITQWSPTIQNNINNRLVWRQDNQTKYTTSEQPKLVRTQTNLMSLENKQYFTSVRLTFTME